MTCAPRRWTRYSKRSTVSSWQNWSLQHYGQGVILYSQHSILCLGWTGTTGSGGPRCTRPSPSPRQGPSTVLSLRWQWKSSTSEISSRIWASTSSRHARIRGHHGVHQERQPHDGETGHPETLHARDSPEPLMRRIKVDTSNQLADIVMNQWRCGRSSDSDGRSLTAVFERDMRPM
jgi:hypothetical protein